MERDMLEPYLPDISQVALDEAGKGLSILNIWREKYATMTIAKPPTLIDYYKKMLESIRDQSATYFLLISFVNTLSQAPKEILELVQEEMTIGCEEVQGQKHFVDKPFPHLVISSWVGYPTSQIKHMFIAERSNSTNPEGHGKYVKVTVNSLPQLASYGTDGTQISNNVAWPSIVVIINNWAFASNLRIVGGVGESIPPQSWPRLR